MFGKRFFLNIEQIKDILLIIKRCPFVKYVLAHNKASHLDFHFTKIVIKLKICARF